ncbi:MAG: ABC transporter permease [Dehalococcoidales bacterium]|nr:ABC transporter permease [Dehalococcoidales bacterium]
MNKRDILVSTGDTVIESIPESHRTRELERFRRIFLGRPVVIFGLMVIFLLVIAAIFAPWLAPYDPYKQDLDQALLQPGLDHLLGTDSLGRDTLSRLIFGSRNAIMVGAVSVGIASILGMIIGLIAGYLGGWVRSISMRLIDTLMCFPMILLALVIAALLGGGLRNVMIALGISLLPGYARLMCGQVMSIKENDYIMAGHATGVSAMRLMFRHIFPNCLPPLIVLITMQIGAAILAEAGLSFIGVGIELPAAAWGSMVNSGRVHLLDNPILSFAPGVAIMLVVFSFNMVGDGLRDYLDPRLRGLL